MRSAIDLRRLAHEIANQLTVINLSCYKIRGALAQGHASSISSDTERVEKAVGEITSLIQSLSLIEADSNLSVTHAPLLTPAQPGNVYPLCDAIRKSRDQPGST